MVALPQRLLLAALALALASIAGAWVSELGFGYMPCKLCLLQRWPYYIGIPFGLAAYLTAGAQPRLSKLFQAAFVLAFLVGAGLAIYHSGAEWKFWPGPSDCGGRLSDGPSNVLDLRNSLKNIRVIRCDEAPLRILGLSFAGWNVVVSIAVAILAGLGLKRR